MEISLTRRPTTWRSILLDVETGSTIHATREDYFAIYRSLKRMEDSDEFKDLKFEMVIDKENDCLAITRIK